MVCLASHTASQVMRKEFPGCTVLPYRIYYLPEANTSPAALEVGANVNQGGKGL